jgi:multidrug resistance efflux pump
LELHELAKQKLDMEQLSLNVLNREETLQLRIRMLEETVATQEARIEYYVSKYIPDFGNSVPKEELDNQTSSSHNDILAKINSLQEWEQSLQMKEQQLSQEQQQVQALRNECNQELSQLEKEREDLKFVKRSIESHNEYMKHRMEEKLELLS